MTVRLIALILCIAQLAVSCASFRSTPYQPSIGDGYGYTDEQIDPGEYRIAVSGNAVTSAETLWNQLLLRAAEITLNTGHGYFVVVPNAAGDLVDIKPAYLMPQFGLGPGAAFGLHPPLIQYEGYPVGVEPSRELIATGTIIVSNQRPNSENNVFDAEQVRNRLKSKITRSAL